MNKILLTLTTLICMNANSKMVEMKFDYSQEQENGRAILHLRQSAAIEHINLNHKILREKYFDGLQIKLKRYEEAKTLAFGEENLDKLNESIQHFKSTGDLLYFSTKEAAKNSNPYEEPKSHVLYFLEKDIKKIDNIIHILYDIVSECGKAQNEQLFNEYDGALAFFDTLSLFEYQNRMAPERL